MRRPTASLTLNTKGLIDGLTQNESRFCQVAVQVFGLDDGEPDGDYRIPSASTGAELSFNDAALCLQFIRTPVSLQRELLELAQQFMDHNGVTECYLEDLGVHFQALGNGSCNIYRHQP